MYYIFIVIFEMVYFSYIIITNYIFLALLYVGFVSNSKEETLKNIKQIKVLL